MKKSLKVALSAVCFIAAGAFFMGCSSPAGGGFTPKYAVGDIVLNDGTKVAYSVAKDYAVDDLTNLQSKAVAVIFKADTESKPALGVGIKHERNGLAWCIKDAAGYDTNFTDTVCDPDGGTEAPNLTFKNSPNTDGSKNLAKMVLQMQNEGKDDTKLTAFTSGKLILFDKKLLSTYYTNIKNNYPAFEFAYYYGLNYGHNITSGSDFENGWYLPSLSELNDIFQANKTDSVIENALGVTGGDKFNGSWYWSSSQYASDDSLACQLKFNNGDWYTNYKYCTSDYVCAVRAFN